MGRISVERREGSSWQAGILGTAARAGFGKCHTDLSSQTQKTIPKTYSRRIRSNPPHPRKSATTLGHCGQCSDNLGAMWPARPELIDITPSLLPEIAAFPSTTAPSIFRLRSLQRGRCKRRDPIPST
jgi:hypothetical protein